MSSTLPGTSYGARFTVPGGKSDCRTSILVRQNGIGAVGALPAF